MQKLLGYMRSAVQKYNMIEDGDRIAVGVSCGKDSLALLAALSFLCCGLNDRRERSRAETILEEVKPDLILAETDEEWNAIRDRTIQRLVELGEPEVFEAYRQKWDAAAAVIVPLVLEKQVANGIEPYTPEQYERHP